MKLLASGSEPVQRAAWEASRYFELSAMLRQAGKDAGASDLPAAKRVLAIRALRGGRFDCCGAGAAAGDSDASGAGSGDGGDRFAGGVRRAGGGQGDPRRTGGDTVRKGASMRSTPCSRRGIAFRCC